MGIIEFKGRIDFDKNGVFIEVIVFKMLFVRFYNREVFDDFGK